MSSNFWLKGYVRLPATSSPFAAVDDFSWLDVPLLG
jgi:hypothetical protein